MRIHFDFFIILMLSKFSQRKRELNCYFSIAMAQLYDSTSNLKWLKASLIGLSLKGSLDRFTFAPYLLTAFQRSS